MHKHKEAIGRYTMAASIAVQRPPWESNQLMREELSHAVSNRSASYCESQDYISALADAETVISIRRNWSKGHFRKAKALVGLGALSEAVDALQVGLAFEPNNAVRIVLRLVIPFVLNLLCRNLAHFWSKLRR